MNTNPLDTRQRLWVFRNGIGKGPYEVYTEHEALDAYAHDNGYDTFAHLLEKKPNAWRDTFTVEAV